MPQKLPQIYEKRAQLLRLSLDIGLSAAELNQLVTPMEGKTEEEKEAIAAELFEKLNAKCSSVKHSSKDCS